MAAEFVTTIKMNEAPVGGVTAIDVRGTRIAVANVSGTYYAFDDACTHEQCSLAEQGELAGTTLTCTCHGSEFDLRTDFFHDVLLNVAVGNCSALKKLALLRWLLRFWLWVSTLSILTDSSIVLASGLASSKFTVPTKRNDRGSFSTGQRAKVSVAATSSGAKQRTSRWPGGRSSACRKPLK